MISLTLVWTSNHSNSLSTRFLSAINYIIRTAQYLDDHTRIVLSEGLSSDLASFSLLKQAGFHLEDLLAIANFSLLDILLGLS